MVMLVAAGLWAALVAYLLLRIVRQGRAYAASALPAPLRRPVAGSVAIIVPVRNEIANVEGCVRSLLAQTGLPPRCELIVVDDDSTDGTAETVARLAATEPRLRLVRAGRLPAGWIGKPHACWRGAAASRDEWLCFVDADLRAEPPLVAAAIAAAERHGVEMLSVAPFQELGGFWERLIVPAGMLVIAGAMDLRRIDDRAAPEVTANGQFLLFRGDAYRAVGGHAAVRGEICEDKALAHLFKRSGRRFRLMSGDHLARVRMYRDLPALWEGFAKNAVEILGRPGATVTAASAGLGVALAAAGLPLWMVAGWRWPADASALPALALSLAGSLALLGVQLGTLRRCRVGLRYVALFPAAYAAVAALAWSSLWWRATGRIRWKGRAYEIERKAAPG